MRFFPTVIASILGTLIALGVGFFFFLVLLVGLASTGEPAPSIRSGSVLEISLSGLVPESEREDPLRLFVKTPRSGTVRQISSALRKAADDDRVSAVWVRLSGVANAWASLEEISHSLETFRRSGKPVVASSDDEGYTEKDYFVAVQANHVVSAPAARFEMNGLALILQFMKRLFDKLDIEPEAIRAGNFKSAVEPFTRTDASEENRAQIQTILDVHSALYTNTVAEQRGLTPETVKGIIDSSSVTRAEQALDRGLIDSLLVVDGVLDLLRALTRSDGEFERISARDYDLATRSAGGGGTVAVVNAFGTIMSGESEREVNPLLGGVNVGSATLVRLLRKLRTDETIDAIVLRINSPGGSAAASDAIWHAIKETATVKPVVASLSDVAASGGYYIAAAADSIVAQKTSLTGSIGVFSLVLDVSGLVEDKIGLTHESIATAPHADMLSGLRPLTKRERALLADDVDRTYERFKEIVRTRRDMTEADVEALAKGRVWTGADASRLGLVDRIGGLQSAVEMAAFMAGLEAGRYRTSTFPRPRGLLEQLGTLMDTQAASILQSLRREMAVGPLLRQAEVIEAAVQLHGEPQALIPFTVSVE